MVPFAVLLPWLHRKAGSWHRARGVACAGGALGTGGDEPRSTLGPDSPTFGRSNNDPSTAEVDVNSAWNSCYRFWSGIL